MSVLASLNGSREVNYSDRNGEFEWAGLWQLDRRQMTWTRDQVQYAKDPETKKVEKKIVNVVGLMVRSKELICVNDLTAPLIVLRNAQNQVPALPEELDGLWFDTPTEKQYEMDSRLGGLGLVGCWRDFDRQRQEVTSLEPAMAGFINAENSESFNRTPLGLFASILYVRPQ